MFKSRSNSKKTSTLSKWKSRLRKLFISQDLSNMSLTGRISSKNFRMCSLMSKHLPRKKQESIRSFVKSLKTWSISTDLISKNSNESSSLQDYTKSMSLRSSKETLTLKEAYRSLLNLTLISMCMLQSQNHLKRESCLQRKRQRNQRRVELKAEKVWKVLKVINLILITNRLRELRINQQCHLVNVNFLILEMLKLQMKS